MDSAGSRRVPGVPLSNVRAADPNPPTDPDSLFRSVFEEGFDYVWNTVRRLGVAPADIEDVSHDVMLDVYRKMGTYDPARPLKPWLFAFSFRAVSEYRRKQRVRREVREEVEAVDRAPLADAQLVAEENRALVAAALETLDLDRRAVFVLHDLDDVPIPDVARTLEIPLNTAYSRLRVAREKFVKALKRLQARGEAT
ncbi:MAG: sigma-70 family RNA polymerase sigma factor [Polyangiaceae bacterium]